jgi:cysteine desulfuration protein SufE
MTDKPMPPKLADLLAEFADIEDRYERYEILTEFADAFRPVPPEIARRPYPQEHLVPYCESQMYFWSQENGDHTLTFYFASENAQSISARAMAAILDETCSGVPAWQVVHIPDDLPQRFFGQDLAMGRTLGLTSLVGMVKAAARAHVQACPSCQAQAEA